MKSRFESVKIVKKVATCYSAKSYSKNNPKQKQLASSTYQRTQPLAKFLTNTCRKSNLFPQQLSILNNFSLFRKRCTITRQPETILMTLKNLKFFLFYAWILILQHFFQKFGKTVSFDGMVHIIDEENPVIYVDFHFNLPFQHEAPPNIGQINRERISICRSCEKH